MATASQATPSPVPDPARLGAEQSPEISREDDAHDMSPVIAETDKDQGPATGAPLGSDFARQRRQGAEGNGTPTGDVGESQGMGRAGYNGDEDRGYDQSNYRGGLGSAGGRDVRSTQPAAPAAPNPFVGGPDQPSAEQTQHLGLNTPSPTDKPEDAQ